MSLPYQEQQLWQHPNNRCPRGVTLRVDDQGRVRIPQKEKDRLGNQPGDTLYMVPDGDSLRIIKVDFNVLARHARQEYDAGRTRSLEEVAEERGINLVDEHPDSENDDTNTEKRRLSL